MKKEASKINRGGVILPLLSGFSGLALCFMAILILAKRFEISWAILLVLGIYVLAANLRQIYLVLKSEQERK